MIQEYEDYVGFTGPARLSKGIHTLEGILLGIAIDKDIHANELGAIIAWARNHHDMADRHPFNEILALIDESLSDGILTLDEHQDLLWCCRQFSADGDYYHDTTEKMQRLQGILAGIIADGVVTDEEAKGLAEWLEDKQDLKTVWPYAEIDSLLTSALAGGSIDDSEREKLRALFEEFSGLRTRPKRAVEDGKPPLITGICASDPKVKLAGQGFYLTGEATMWTKSEFERIVTNLGGIWTKRVTKATDYLVVGGGGNPCWTYSCYGRQIEKAVAMRKKGHRILVIHEFDMQDAIQDAS